MTDHEIEQIASRILHQRLHGFGFTNAEARSEIDFDGSPVIRVKARYTDENTPTRAITQAMNEIRSELIHSGEQRFVLLEGEYLGEEAIDEDVN